MEFISPKPEKYAAPMPKAAPPVFPKRPRRKRDREGKQQALMLAAGKLFSERGFEATTTRDIAACAGCAEGLIHRYFGGKAGLFQALIEKRNSRNTNGNGHFPLAATFQADFLEIVRTEVECRWEERDFLRMTIPRALLDPTLGALLAGEADSQHATTIAQRLRQFSECRDLSDTDIAVLVRLVDVIGFSFGFLHPVIFGQDLVESRKMAAAVIQLVIRNLRR